MRISDWSSDVCSSDLVENRPGASGTIATQQVVRSAPDGYTLLFATASPLTGAPLTMKGLQYDPMKDLDPITLVGNGPFILVANQIGRASCRDRVCKYV